VTNLYQTIIAIAAAIARAWNPNVGRSSDPDENLPSLTTGVDTPVDAFRPLYSVCVCVCVCVCVFVCL
jgi:hypothetical protein